MIPSPTRQTNLKYWGALPGLVILCCLLSWAHASPLKNHPSAYLALHADDPVKWQLWDQNSLSQARHENKLIFISSGYFACHWCHVMQQENYQNPQIAEALNRNFISIKIDREIHADLDDHLIHFARQATGQAGWPLHVILTPDGYPFASFIYQPTSQLIQTLNQLQHWWLTQPDQIQRLAQPEQTAKQTTTYTQETFRRTFFEQILTQLDLFEGGLQATQKFPSSPLLNALLQQPSLNTTIEDWLILTLEQMQNEHLYDHVFDGFFRYTIDPNWQIPHFEKMLYDNAQLAEIYMRAGARFQRSDFIQTAENTLSYIQQSLFSPITGLARASQSALDEQGQDGGRYLWTAPQLKALLSAEDYALVDQAWLLTQPAPIESAWLPKPLNHSRWPDIKQRLQQRTDVTDSKQLLSWNGLLLSAYAQAYSVTKKSDYLLRGHALSQRLLDLIHLQQPPRALTDEGHLLGEALLEDYAYLLTGLQAWQNASGFDLELAQTFIKQRAQRLFFTEQGWLARAEQLPPGQSAERHHPDQATPSASVIFNCTSDSVMILPENAPLWSYASYLTPCEP